MSDSGLHSEITSHGCALVLGNKGILVRGPSGSGKSMLTQMLIDNWQTNGLFACWVADDRVMLKATGLQIIARAPQALLGLAERRFAGIKPVDCLQCAVIDVVIDLVEPDRLERLPVAMTTRPVETGREIPLFHAPAGDNFLALAIVSRVLDEESCHFQPELKRKL